MISHHKYNEHESLNKIIAEIKEGKQLALISDAGTPGISDPGFLLVRHCIEHNIPVETLPGPSALLPALINSGLPCNEFVFIGFLPVKKGRETKLKSLHTESRTMILFESPHRVVKTLEQLLLHLGDRRASVSRELSKKFEETKRGALSELLAYFRSKEPKGEFVIVVEGAEQ
jgi:16S rRNA (cytidine1402-2'-O)-methyltransferase